MNYKYGFWIWSNKLNPILSILGHLAGYEIIEEEREIILLELMTTNDENDLWTEFLFSGNRYVINLKLAYDNNEGTDMVHLKINTSSELKESLKAMNLFQSMFKELIE